MRAVITKIRTFCTAMIYLDDVILLASSQEAVREAARQALLLLRSLGLTVNFRKSMLEPSQQFTYLGFVWKTVEMTVEIEERKRTNAREEVSKFIRRARQGVAFPIRSLASLVGTLTSFSLAEQRTLVHSRRLMDAVSSTVKRLGWQGSTTLAPAQLSELEWWHTTLTTPVRSSIRPFVPNCTLTTDASEFAAGALLEFNGREQAFQKEWTLRESRRSSNAREMMAVLRALHHFSLRNVDVLVRTDNTTTLFDINRRSSALSLNSILTEILDLCHEREIRVRAVYIPGKDNVAADNLSRLYDSTDCMLSRSIFLDLCQRLRFTPTLDAFASGWNAQVPRFLSLNREIRAIGMNGLYHSWKGESGVYAYPPIPLIPHVLRKAMEERVPLLLITPDWETLPSIHLLRSLSVRHLRLPEGRRCVRIGPGMLAVGASIAPGRLMAWVL
jgi:ribonuclease HI